METEPQNRTMHVVTRGFVSLALLGFCFGTATFVLPTFSVMISSSGGSLAVWATAPLGWIPWILGLVMLGGAVMTVRAEKAARSATVASAMAAVDFVLVLWVIGIGLFLLDVVITIPALTR